MSHIDNINLDLQLQSMRMKLQALSTPAPPTGAATLPGAQHIDPHQGPGTHPHLQNTSLKHRARLQLLIGQSDTKVALIKDLIEENEAQAKELEDLRLDLKNLTRTARELQKIFEQTERRLGEDAEQATQGNYVAVLLDGDGMIFNPEYLRRGRSGGKEAATALHGEVQALIQQCSAMPVGNSTISARVFANAEGLATALRQRGLTHAHGDLKEFALGLTQSCELMYFVDVGSGKEMADSKIIGELQFHLRNPYCKLIILGVSHDNGYARILTSILTKSQAKTDRIILLEGIPFAREFTGLPFRRVRFHDLFMTKNLDYYDSSTAPPPPQQKPDIPPPPYSNPASFERVKSPKPAEQTETPSEEGVTPAGSSTKRKVPTPSRGDAASKTKQGNPAGSAEGNAGPGAEGQKKNPSKTERKGRQWQQQQREQEQQQREQQVLKVQQHIQQQIQQLRNKQKELAEREQKEGTQPQEDKQPGQQQKKQQKQEKQEQQQSSRRRGRK